MAKPRPLPPLRAWAVQEDYESTGGIVFARYGIVARRAGAAQFNDGEFSGLTVRRAPWADKYAPGPVPALAMIRDGGWFFECGHCQRRIYDGADDDSDAEVTADNAVEVESTVYCSPICRRRFLNEKSERRALTERRLQSVRNALWRKCPGITLMGRDHVYLAPRTRRGWIVGQTIVNFIFPGQPVGICQYRHDKAGEELQIHVPRGALEAWQKWRAQQEAE